MSRDPLLSGASAGLDSYDLYSLAANGVLNSWDLLGLLPDAGRGLPGVDVKGGCCCANHVGPMHMSATQVVDTYSFGFNFTVYANVGAKENPTCPGSCRLLWTETSNYDMTDGHQSGVPFESSDRVRGSSAFKRWRETELEAPIEMHAIYFDDTPRISTHSLGKAPVGPGAWTLKFEITVYSAEGCGCNVPEATTSFVLTSRFIKKAANHNGMSGMYVIEPNLDGSGIR